MAPACARVLAQTLHKVPYHFDKSSGTQKAF